jgi:hypothetical protein
VSARAPRLAQGVGGLGRRGLRGAAMWRVCGRVCGRPWEVRPRGCGRVACARARWSAASRRDTKSHIFISFTQVRPRKSPKTQIKPHKALNTKVVEHL